MNEEKQIKVSKCPRCWRIWEERPFCPRCKAVEAPNSTPSWDFLDEEKNPEHYNDYIFNSKSYGKMFVGTTIIMVEAGFTKNKDGTLNILDNNTHKNN